MSDSNFVSLNEYKVLNVDNPLGYTNDITSCIGMIVYRENSVVLAHIASYKEQYNVNLKIVFEILGLKDDTIKNVELFSGEETNNFNMFMVGHILNGRRIPFEEKPAFTNTYHNGSIGYNFNSKKYYYYSDEDKFEEYNNLQTKK